MAITNYKKNKAIIYLLFILYALYNLQGTLYTSGSTISQSVLFIIIFVSLFYFVKTLLFERKDAFYTAWTAFFLLNVFGFIFTGNISNEYHFSLFKNILVCVSSFYPCYYFVRNNSLIKKDLIFFFILMLPITMLQYIFNQSSILEETLSGEDTIVNNISYNFVLLMPFVFLIKKKRLISFILMLVILFFVIQGAKRGAIVVGTIILIVYFYSQLKSVEKRHRIKGYFFVLSGVTIISILTYKNIINNEFLLTRFNSIFEGNLSERDVIYAKIWNSWFNSENPLNFFFGYGFAGSLELSGGSFAHNDWLEIISNFGFLGAILYLYLFITVFSSCFIKSSSQEKKILMFVIVSTWFLTSMFSMWYTSIGVFTQAMLLGYLTGSRSKVLD